MKTEKVSVRIFQMKRFPSVAGNERLLCCDVFCQEKRIQRIHIRTTEIQRNIFMRRDAHRIRRRRSLVLFICRVQHQFNLIASQQGPIKMLTLWRRSADHLKADDFRIESDRSSHVENLEQRRHPLKDNAFLIHPRK
jgi:hypothetical protein